MDGMKIGTLALLLVAFAMASTWASVFGNSGVIYLNASQTAQMYSSPECGMAIYTGGQQYNSYYVPYIPMWAQKWFSVGNRQEWCWVPAWN